MADHKPELVDFLVREFRVDCLCGWEGRVVDDLTIAAAGWAGHLRKSGIRPQGASIVDFLPGGGL
jgi:hypothetical protein